MPAPDLPFVRRREFLSLSARTAAAATLATTPAAVLADLLATPRLTEGPFYPDKLPLDTDNDLLIVNEATAHGLGEITHLSGRVLSRAGEPIRGAVVEIWQCDSEGAYLHSRGESREARDANFQGYGRFLTDSSGAYYFRTIKPVPYPGRTPHIHFAVRSVRAPRPHHAALRRRSPAERTRRALPKRRRRSGAEARHGRLPADRAVEARGARCGVRPDRRRDARRGRRRRVPRRDRQAAWRLPRRPRRGGLPPAPETARLDTPG